jgi:hypothetical protein
LAGNRRVRRCLSDGELRLVATPPAEEAGNAEQGAAEQRQGSGHRHRRNVYIADLEGIRE